MQGSTRSSSPAWDMDMQTFLDSEGGLDVFKRFLKEELGEDFSVKPKKAKNVIDFR